MSEKITAPFTDDQITALNAWQTGGQHPFTCAGNTGDEAPGTFDVLLIARADGWYCPVCGYRQTWAWDFMAAGAGDGEDAGSS